MGWMSPAARRHKQPSAQRQEGAAHEDSVPDVHVLAIGLAKLGFQVCATDRWAVLFEPYPTRSCHSCCTRRLPAWSRLRRARQATTRVDGGTSATGRHRKTATDHSVRASQACRELRRNHTGLFGRFHRFVMSNGQNSMRAEITRLQVILDFLARIQKII